MPKKRRSYVRFVTPVALLPGFAALWWATAAPQSAPSPQAAPALVEILESELKRNFEGLKQADPAPYFISYSVTEEQVDGLSATLGVLQATSKTHRRVFDCSVRVGSPQLDNYHVIDGDRPRQAAAAALPLEDKPDAIQRLVWRETDAAWRTAAQRFVKVRTSTQVKQQAERDVPDFSTEEPAAAFRTVAVPKFSVEEWAPRLKRLSARFTAFPGVVSSGVTLEYRREWKTLVNTEGSRLQHGRVFLRVSMHARAKAQDGHDLLTTQSFEASDPSRLPKDDVLVAAVDKTARDLVQLLRVQPVDPYLGPAILSGRAAGVFFHEIFGHRVEGHRQRDEREGQTFTNSVGQAVLPEFLSVIFDPTRRSAAQTDLNGAYDFDDEGVPARPVAVVEKGILKTFLMSRTPLEAFPASNAHGRKQPGLEVVSRQSNLIVESAKRVPEAQLRKMLIAEARRQNKPYGLYFEQVTGGYTTTQRRGLQAFTVIPLVVYRVHTDGRPDELVRGVDIVGTPLASFGKIMATGDRDEVFNGYCGAESGNVPVAAVSPALLVSEIEVQRKAAPSDRPPLLPRPSAMEAVR